VVRDFDGNNPSIFQNGNVLFTDEQKRELTVGKKMR